MIMQYHEDSDLIIDAHCDMHDKLISIDTGGGVWKLDVTEPYDQ